MASVVPPVPAVWTYMPSKLEPVKDGSRNIAVTTPVVVTTSSTRSDAAPVPWMSAIVTSSGAAATVITKVTDAVDGVGSPESVTVAVASNVPAAVGVPLTRPAVLRVTPSGSAPAVRAHV